MKKNILSFVLSTCLMFNESKTNAQTSSITSLQDKLVHYTSNHLEEKLYLHTDKSVYFNNEVCWFKIYNIDAFFNTPLQISSVAYFELLNAANEPVMQEKIELKSGSGNGSILFPNNLPSGQYTIRAYTNWMKNFNPNYFFTKKIRFVNTQIAADSTISVNESNTTQINKYASTGYRIDLDEMQNEKEIQLKLSSNKNPSEPFGLIIHHRGIAKKAFTGAFKNGLYQININKNDLGVGVNTITLFSNNQQVVSERLYYIYPKQGDSDLLLNVELTNYKPRQKVNLSIQPAVQNGSAVNMNLSLAVYKLDGIQAIDEINIQNYVWLQSDLETYIDSPNHYFDAKHENRFEQMNQLMQKNNWGRFNWEQVLTSTPSEFKFTPEMAGNIMKGRIVQRTTEQPMQESAGYVSMPGKNTQFKSSISDQNGNVQFEFRDLHNDGQIIVQADSNKNFRNKVVIENPFYTDATRPTLVIKKADKLNASDLNNYYRNIQVQNFYTPNYIQQFTTSNYDTIPFYGKADRTYLLDNYARFTTLEEVIREYVTPVSLTKADGKFKLSVYDDVNKHFFTGDPLILLDGVVIKDVDKFLEYDPLKIRKLEVVSKLYFLGNLAYNGIINFTTYNGKMEAYELDPNSVVLDYKGLQSQRYFKAPSYDTQNEIDSRIPDFRHLLFWEPNIKFATSSKKKISFFTSDEVGTYAIILQGITSNGDPIYKEQLITVQP